MTTRDGTLVKGFILFVFLLFLGIAVTVYTQRATVPPAKAVTPEAKEPASNVQDVHSSKAEKKLIMRVRGTSYGFYIADIIGGNELLIYSKTLKPGVTMSIPFNSWDPTDTYVFVEERIGGVPNYYVLKANGESFASGEKFIDVGAVWIDKKIGFTIRQATGWASGTLLVVYTSKEDGSRGPAFWFEIPSTAIIQLAG